MNRYVSLLSCLDDCDRTIVRGMSRDSLFGTDVLMKFESVDCDTMYYIGGKSNYKDFNSNVRRLISICGRLAVKEEFGVSLGECRSYISFDFDYDGNVVVLIYFDCDDSLILRGVYSSDCSLLVESDDDNLYSKIRGTVKYILDFLKVRGNIFSIGIYPLCSDMLLVEDYKGHDVYIGSRKSDIGIGKEFYDIAIFI